MRASSRASFVTALWSLLFVAATAAAQSSAAQPPTVIPVAGALKGDAGGPRTGTVRLAIALYANADDPSPLWLEYQDVALDDRGQYQTYFGSTLPDGLPAHLFTDGAARWIGIGVEGEPEGPRVMLVSVPYAARATVAESLAGRPASEFVLQENLRDAVQSALRAPRTRAFATDDPIDGLFAAANIVPKFLDASATLIDSTIVDVGGRVGIGIASPTAVFHVGNEGFRSFKYQPANGIADVEILTNNNAQPAFVIRGTGTADLVRWFDNTVPVFRVRDGGFFGIGNNTASGVLHIGADALRFLKYQPSAGLADFEVVTNNNVQPALAIKGTGTADLLRLLDDTTSVLTVRDGGLVGIGTSAPSFTFDVDRPVVGNYVAHFRNLNAAQPFTVLIQEPSVGTSPGFPLLAVTNSAVSTEYLRVNSGGTVTMNGGNVGIGTTNPVHKLHVVGNVSVDGNIGAKYQDVAEWVDAVETLEPGTIVSIDPTGSNRVQAVARAYDTAVAGAISIQPGIVLGEPGEGRVLVAQSGRVRVKADATFGAIRPGDLLVASSTPGHVMVSKPTRIGGHLMHRPGTIVGKALEALPNGRGEILVLLTLQ